MPVRRLASLTATVAVMGSMILTVSACDEYPTDSTAAPTAELQELLEADREWFGHVRVRLKNAAENLPAEIPAGAKCSTEPEPKLEVPAFYPEDETNTEIVSLMEALDPEVALDFDSGDPDGRDFLVGDGNLLRQFWGTGPRADPTPTLDPEYGADFSDYKKSSDLARRVRYVVVVRPIKYWPDGRPTPENSVRPQHWADLDAHVFVIDADDGSLICTAKVSAGDDNPVVGWQEPGDRESQIASLIHNRLVRDLAYRISEGLGAKRVKYGDE